jgi:hypothetical protein
LQEYPFYACNISRRKLLSNPGNLLPSPKNENTSIIPDDANNCPVQTSEIGLMSERDQPAQNAVNPNFNDDISNYGSDNINMSTTHSIYSQLSENSKNSVHLYAPKLKHAFDTTHTSITAGV